MPLDTRLVEALSTPSERRNAERESRLRSELASLEATLDELAKEIDDRFPEYAELTRREPLALAETQELLLPGEALLTFVRSLEGDKTHVFVVRRNRTDAYSVGVGVEELVGIVVLPDWPIEDRQAADSCNAVIKWREDGYFTEIGNDEASRRYGVVAVQCFVLSALAHVHAATSSHVREFELGVDVRLPSGNAWGLGKSGYPTDPQGGVLLTQFSP